MKEIEIPEGYEARIEGNKVIIEPKESKDERIKKELLDYLKDKKKKLDYLCFELGDVKNAPFSEAKQVDDFLAYLERQEESWVPTDEQRHALGMVIKHSNPNADSTKVLESLLDDLTKIANSKVAKWKENQKEQKPVTKFKVGDKVHFKGDDVNILTITGLREDAYCTDSAYGPILFSDQDEWEIVQQKPAEWSEEDEKAIERAIDCVRAWEVDYCDGDNTISERLKSLRPQPQRKDTYYDIIHNILASLKDVDFMQITPEHRVSLLNDIRVKCKNADECAAILDEPHWKPSKEQMDALRVSSEYEPCLKNREHLKSLYNNLKSL